MMVCASGGHRRDGLPVRDHLQQARPARESGIPEGGDRLIRFVAEHLGPTLKERLGYDAADAILTSLEPIVQMATEEISQVRPASSVRPQGTAKDPNSSKVTPRPCR
jgi:hypothetical protein